MTHTYSTLASGAIVEIKIRGTFPRLFCNATATAGYCPALRSVEQWGSIVRSTMANAFQGASELVINATDTPNLTKVRDMTSMFQGVVGLTGNFSGWDMNNVTTMTNMFYGATSFNRPLESWNMSKVTTLNSMFQGATSFNQPLSSWNVENVTSMYQMLYGATSFNQPLS
jgi:surface protein